MSDGIVGRCKDCGRLMGTANRYKDLGLPQHRSNGLCRPCAGARKRGGINLKPVVAGDEQWMEDAACLGTDTEAFYPEAGGSTREAKRVCNNGCPVIKECLDFALRHRGDIGRFGVFGGLSERERRRLYASLDQERQDEAA
jgi:Transcription factor WhiB